MISSVIIKLQTSTWHDSRGIHLKKSLTFLKKQCEGFNFVEEDVANIGANDIITKIINLDECSDGVYKIIMCNLHRDYESGYIEDYDYQLLKLD